MAAADEPRPDGKRSGLADLDDLLTPGTRRRAPFAGALDDLLTPEPPRPARRPPAPAAPPRPQKPPAQPAPVEAEAPAPVESPPADPKLDDMNAILAELGFDAADASALAPTPEPAAKAPVHEVEVDPAELDALLSELGFQGDAPRPKEPDDRGISMSQEELDAMLSAAIAEREAEREQAKSKPPPQPEVESAPASTSMSQEELDALLAGETGDTDTPAAPAETQAASIQMTQEELDALLGGMDSDDAPVEPAEATAQDVAPEDDADGGLAIDQDELDALIAAAMGEPDEPAADMDAPIGGDAMDAGVTPNLADDPDSPVASGQAVEEDAAVDLAPRDAVPDEEAAIVDAAPAEAPEPSPEPVAEADPVELVGTENEAAASGAEPEDLLDEEALNALIDQALVEGAAAEPPDDAADLIEAPAFEPDTEKEDNGEPPMDPDIAAAIDLEALVVDDGSHAGQAEESAGGQAAGGTTGGAKDGAGEVPPAKAARSRIKLPSIRIVLPSISMKGFMDGLQQNAIRIATATSAGMVVTMGTFTLLLTNPVRDPAPAEMAAVRQPTLDEALVQARAAMQADRFGEAVTILDEAIARAPESPQLADARYMRIQAGFHAMGDYASERERLAFHGEVNEFELNFPGDPRVARALAWQGELYEREGHVYDARRSYRKIEANYPNYDDMPGVLLASARLALATNQPNEALTTLENLMRSYPGAPLTGEARLLLAKTYYAQGERHRARELLEGIARTQAHTGVGAAATAQLARLAFEDGRYDEAIEMLEARRRRATTIEGNDEVYLLLAQAYRDSGQLAEAERVLRELIDFFPDTPLMPHAYLALSGVLEQAGRREDALRLANLALDRYEDDPAILRNAAELLERTGQPREAAELYMRADAIDDGDPATRLRAGRAFLEAGDAGRAREALGALADAFPGTPEAISAGIEWARATHRAGDPDAAITRLQSLRDQTLGQPAQVPVLLAMAEIFADLGLRQPLADVQREVAALTNEPQRVAQAAIDMIDAGLYEPGFAAADRVDPLTIRPELAYELMNRHARALLRTDPGRAIAKMEQAIKEFPAYRTPEGDRTLFRAYLSTEQPALARVMLADLEQQARRDPLLHDRTLDLATILGDFHYQRGDYRAALDAYGRVLDAPYAQGEHADWAAFQRANALVRIREFDDALDAYEQIIAQGGPWADDAQLRLGLLAIERRLRTGRPDEAAAR